MTIATGLPKQSTISVPEWYVRDLCTCREAVEFVRAAIADFWGGESDMGLSNSEGQVVWAYYPVWVRYTHEPLYRGRRRVPVLHAAPMRDILTGEPIL